MFRKAVFLSTMILLIGCESPAPHIAHTAPSSPHVQVDPLPERPAALAHPDYHVAVDRDMIILENTNGTAASYQDFTLSHGERAHFMIIDPSLTEYYHLHPQRNRADDMAIYPLTVTPEKGGEYRLFADVTPRVDGVQRFLSTSFYVHGPSSPPQFQPLTEGAIQQTSHLDGLVFNTHLDQPLHAGQASLLNITVTDDQGHLFRELEPLMQAFAHLIGFSAGRNHIVHTHPLGRDVASENARGGPNLMFHVSFPTPGYYRLFLQVRVQDRILTLPLDARVAPSANGDLNDHHKHL